jgi:prepilin-type N-terminal cleavage/methylation domain-containing protein
MRNNRGFTLVELIVVTAVFIVVILISTYAFENIIRRSVQQSKEATTQIEGMVGLEMLRTDLGHAGFALPWSLHVDPGLPPTFKFSEVSTNPANVAGLTASDYNEAIPRAIVSDTPSSGGPDYLVIKSALLALDSTTTGRWGFANYYYNTAISANANFIGTTNDSTIDLQGNVDRVITIRSAFSSTGTQTKELMMASATDFSYTVPGNYSLTTVSSVYQPTDPTDTLIVYGISDRTLAMPYNRADYYIDFNAAKPSSCNPNTGILFKAVAGQNGKYTGKNGEPLIYPLLNCVGDMRVVYHLDMNVDGNPGTYASTNGNSLSSSEGASQSDIQDAVGKSLTPKPDKLRQQLKDVTVYILAHEGQKDLNYTYPATTILVGDRTTGVGVTRTLSDFGQDDWMHYRWKVYKIPVSLKNLE